MNLFTKFHNPNSRINGYIFIYVDILTYDNIISSRRKCTFSPYILVFFHFGPYILILPLLVPKPINECYFRPFRQSTNRNI